MADDKQVCVVTGGNKGIGYSAVKQILQQRPSWIVYLTARDSERGQAAVKRLKDEENLTARFHQLDIDSLDSIRAFRDFLKENHPQGVNVLVNNAAILPSVKEADCKDGEFRFNKQASDLTVKTDFFSVMTLCNELFPLLAENARVVMVSSRLAQVTFMHMCEPMQNKIRACSTVDHVITIMNSFIASDLNRLEQTGWMLKPPTTMAYEPFTLGPIYPYGLAKLGLNLLTTIYQKKFDSEIPESRHIAVNACCPGMVKTELNVYGSLTTDQGADTLVYLATLPPDSPHRGQFFFERKPMDMFVV